MISFLIQWFYLLSLTVWVGGIVFFSFFTTPTIFSALPKEMASQVITAIFPRYYFLGYVCGGIVLLTTLLESVLVRQLPLIRIILIAIMLGSSLYAGMVLRPQVHDIKVKMQTLDEGHELARQLKVKFDRAHRLSVILNMIVLLGGLFLIGIVAFRLKL